ncbi:MAG: S-methyl-5-thioribose-1-phosphate isomerase [Anaerolineales bacterium]|nr:MAG: S-methyl-5-thioribose-1-phosphate isomerase [Anaerolineales bacterium]
MIVRTISWDTHGPAVRMIDQQRLPTAVEFLTLETYESVATAIREMSIRGAPAIGAAAGFGLALAAARSSTGSAQDLWQELTTAAEVLRGTRPTAVNLLWAINRMLKVAEASMVSGIETMRQALVDEAQRIADEDVEINRRIGAYGASFIKNGDTIIHHCNTGALATVDFGTALGVIRTAHEDGKRIHVLVDETRPRLQGARLTAWELDQYGIPHEIITDNAAGYFLQRGEVASIFVGADRVAANGDIANKIGTYMLALAANDNDVPVYCAAPLSTIDRKTASGEAIPIEERDPSEVLDIQRGGMPISPQGSKARNPAFDITPHRLVTALITEAGILEPPFDQSISHAFHHEDEE